MHILNSTSLRAACVLPALLALHALPARSEEIKTAAELGLAGLPPETAILVLESDPTAVPVEPTGRALWGDEALSALPMGSGDLQAITGLRTGCPDLGYSTKPYARDSGNDWPWLPANTLVADDLTLLPGNWIIDCYDVIIRASGAPAHTMTLRAYDACNGTLIPGSQETWTIPVYYGPIVLTGATNVRFSASGTIYFGMTTAANNSDGWYIGQTQAVGSTTNTFQLATDCSACINPPSCSPWAGFIAVLYGCQVPTITGQPANAQICAGGWHQFCVAAQGTGTIQYRWQKDEGDIPGATSACYVATEAGSYRCIVTDTCSTVTSNAATLTVRTGPVVTSPPTGGVICTGHTHDVCVAADAIGTLHYQWKRGGLTLIGATLPCYTASVPGSYTCVLTDDCGSTTSPAALVALASPSTGDFDGDGGVDSADWLLFAPCLAGPGAGLAAGCECVDTDADADADLADFAILQSGFGL